jgi:RNA ligase
MENIEQLSKLVKQGFTDWKQHGNVNAAYHDGLILFNYSSQAQFENRWNWFERVSRGLILNAQTGEVVARPFDKFFNWGERGRTTDARLLEVTEKLDESMGIGYFHNGIWKVATRGSFVSEQALWATQYLNANYDMSGFSQDCTPLFEIIYPDNRIVVDYDNREDLVLLAIRHLEGDYFPYYPFLYMTANRFGFSLPQYYNFNSIRDILSLTGKISANHEGWVLLFADGQRFKIKGDRYKEVHRLVTNASFRRVLEAVATDSFDEMIAGIPDEFLEQIHSWHDEIEAKVSDVTKRVELAFGDAPKDSRKEFALWVSENYSELSPCLFRKLDGKEFKSVILRKEF